MFRERDLHTTRKGFQNEIEESEEESDKEAVRRGQICWQYILKCELLFMGSIALLQIFKRILNEP